MDAVELSGLPWLEAHHQNQMSAENRAVKGCPAVQTAQGRSSFLLSEKAAVTALKPLATALLMP